jgi:hypothetical protein
VLELPKANPLQWPTDWPRTKAPKRSQFGRGSRRSEWTDGGGVKRVAYNSNAHSIRDSIGAVSRELERLGAASSVVSCNLRMKADGDPYSGQKEPADSGVAVYFWLADERGVMRQQVLACDRWDRAADNLWAIAKHIEALRGQDRWGVGSLAQAFAGYVALPAAAGGRPPHEILGLERPAHSDEEIRLAFKRRALECHPDRPNGSAEKWNELQDAYGLELKRLAEYSAAV